MMKSKTVRNIQNIAKRLSAAFVQDAAAGYTTRDSMTRIRSGRNGSGDLETVKRMIRSDRRQITTALRILNTNFKESDLSNIMKSKEQFDFLATETLAGIKRSAWSDKEFKPVYDRLFSVKTVKYVQPELPL